MFSTSIKTLPEAMRFPPQWIPSHVDWHGSSPIPENYWRVVTHDKMDFPRYTRNTLWIAALAVLGTSISSSLVAYGFAKIKFKGRSFLFALMLSTMMVPFPVLMVSLFSIYKWTGDHTPLQMLGTLRPLWLPAWFGSAFNIFLLRQFYITIPDELSEAARIDGCNEFGIWWRVILPLSKPALAVVSLFTFMWAWNDFLGPLIYLQHPDQYTLALGLQVFQSTHGGTEWNLLMAASLLILTPIIVLFFLAQKTFIQGIATTGMKG
jgi:multiple sugar transport system permease protein